MPKPLTLNLASEDRLAELEQARLHALSVRDRETAESYALSMLEMIIEENKDVFIRLRQAGD
jgi:hypothetical protein